MTRKSVNKHRIEQARMQSNRFLFLLHCDGVKVAEIYKRCEQKIFVPMASMKSIEELHSVVKFVDWRVSFAKTKTEDGLREAAFVQCTDCWIEFYREMVKNEENREDLFAQVDPEGKFLDRLRGSESGEKHAT